MIHVEHEISSKGCAKWLVDWGILITYLCGPECHCTRHMML